MPGGPHPIELPAWFQRLRQSEVADPVLKDPRSVGGTRLGVNSDIAFQEVIGGGQADFDQRWHNSKGHDLDPDDPQVDYIGVDRSSAMRRLGERLASAGERSHGMPRIQRRWAKDIASIDWDLAPGWRPVIVIVSYLLASPTLDAAALVAELDGLLTRLGRGPVTVLYTNAIGTNANQRFPDFRAALHDPDFVTVTVDTGMIETRRHKNRSLRYALFQRKRQDTLQLG